MDERSAVARPRRRRPSSRPEEGQQIGRRGGAEAGHGPPGRKARGGVVEAEEARTGTVNNAIRTARRWGGRRRTVHRPGNVTDEPARRPGEQLGLPCAGSQSDIPDDRFGRSASTDRRRRGAGRAPGRRRGVARTQARRRAAPGAPPAGPIDVTGGGWRKFVGGQGSANRASSRPTNTAAAPPDGGSGQGVGGSYSGAG